MAALGAWIAAMAADRGPVTIYARPTTISPNPAEEGGRVVVEMPVRRFRACPGVVRRLLRDAETQEVIAFYDPVPAIYQHPIGMEERLPKTFELPEKLPPRVIYEADVCFHCNVLQQWFPICTTVPPVVFTVIPRAARR